MTYGGHYVLIRMLRVIKILPNGVVFSMRQFKGISNAYMLILVMWWPESLIVLIILNSYTIENLRVFTIIIVVSKFMHEH